MSTRGLNFADKNSIYSITTHDSSTAIGSKVSEHPNEELKQCIRTKFMVQTYKNQNLFSHGEEA